LTAQRRMVKGKWSS